MASTAPGMTDKEAARIIVDVFCGLSAPSRREYVQVLELCMALRIARSKAGSNTLGDVIQWARKVLWE